MSVKMVTEATIASIFLCHFFIFQKIFVKATDVKSFSLQNLRWTVLRKWLTAVFGKLSILDVSQLSEYIFV